MDLVKYLIFSIILYESSALAVKNETKTLKCYACQGKAQCSMKRLSKKDSCPSNGSCSTSTWYNGTKVEWFLRRCTSHPGGDCITSVVGTTIQKDCYCNTDYCNKGETIGISKLLLIVFMMIYIRCIV